MDQAIRELVRRRAENRCEYCRLWQSEQPAFAFHIEHIRPLKHGGTDDEANLALACRRCNLCKASNLSGVDSDTDTIVPLYHPRRDQWEDHFAWRGTQIVGRSPIGNATVQVLQMNDATRMRLRAVAGRH